MIVRSEINWYFNIIRAKIDQNDEVFLQQTFKAQLKKLKHKFDKLATKHKETLGICFLKINLGVQSADDLKQAQDFLENFPLKLKPGSLDVFMDFLHHQQSTKAHFFIKLSKKRGETESQITLEKLPEYQEDQVDTLKEPKKKFR